MNWYILQVVTDQENRAKEHIEAELEHRDDMRELVGNVLIPEKLVWIREGYKITEQRNLFSGYLLVEMELTKHTEHLLLNTPGVIGFIGDEPRPFQYEEVSRLFGLVDETAGTQPVEIPFKVGDVVKITDGPFENFQVKVKGVNTEERKL